PDAAPGAGARAHGAGQAEQDHLPRARARRGHREDPRHRDTQGARREQPHPGGGRGGQARPEAARRVMKIGIISGYVDYHRRGRKNRLAMQPGIGPLLAGLLPRDAEVDLVNETWRDPDWSRDYDLLFISSLHSDFDRARAISHYWRRRGAATVYGGAFASAYPDLCQPYFDSVVVGDPEASIPAVHSDFARRALKARYVSSRYDAAGVAPPRFDLVAGQSYTPLCL